MRLRPPISTVAALLVAPLLAACDGTDLPSRPAWYHDFDQGPFEVGFRSEQLERTAPDGSLRTLTLSVWYPAVEEARGDPVRLDDLLGIVLDEGQLEEAEGLDREAALSAVTTGSAEALPGDASDRALDSPTLARWDVEPAPGPFPLVLWSARHATVLAQAPMSEVLASHGFVVATAWSSDPPLAFLWEDRTAAEKRATIEIHTGDLAHVLSVLRSDTSIDADLTTVLSWSYGGQTAGALQALDPGVRGIVALDANALPDRAEERLAVTGPAVFVVGRDVEGRGLGLLDDVPGPWAFVRLPEMVHGSFNAMEGYLPNVLGAEAVFPWAQIGPEARDGYRALTRIVHQAVVAFSGPEEPSGEELAEQSEAAAGDVSAEIRHSN